MRFSNGDVVLIYFPDSNLQTARRRPAVVVMADDLKTNLPQTIVAMITSNTSRAGHSSRVEVFRASPQGQAMGILTDSVIMTGNLATVLHSEIDRIIGHVPDLTPVKAALRHTLGL